MQLADREHFSMEMLNKMYEEAMNPGMEQSPQDTELNALLEEAKAQRGEVVL